MTQKQAYHLNVDLDPPRNKKTTNFHNNEHTNIIISESDITFEECRENLKHIHTIITSNTFVTERITKLLKSHSTDIHSSKQTLPRHMRTKLAQLRANKSPLLQSCLNTMNSDTYIPQCPLCLTHTIGANYLFNCKYQHNTTPLVCRKTFGSCKDLPRVLF